MRFMDLTGLITTIVTSIAALVAIIGGLLVSRVISLANDKQFYQRELDMLTNDKQHASSQLDYFVQQQNELKLKFLFRESTLQKFIDNELTLEEILENDTEYDYTSVDAKSFYNDVVAINDDIVHVLDKFDDFSLKEYMAMTSLKDTYFDEKVENTIYKEITEDLLSCYERISRRIAASKSSFPALNYHPMNEIFLNDNLFSASIDALSPQIEKSTLELSLLTDKINRLENLRDKYGKTNSIWIGLVVLICASVIGILYPASLLPYPKDFYDDVLTKRFLMSLFTFSLVMIFGYIFFYLWKLTDVKSKRNSIK